MWKEHIKQGLHNRRRKWDISIRIVLYSSTSLHHLLGKVSPLPFHQYLPPPPLLVHWSPFLQRAMKYFLTFNKMRKLRPAWWHWGVWWGRGRRDWQGARAPRAWCPRWRGGWQRLRGRPRRGPSCRWCWRWWSSCTCPRWWYSRRPGPGQVITVLVFDNWHSNNDVI